MREASAMAEQAPRELRPNRPTAVQAPNLTQFVQVPNQPNVVLEQDPQVVAQAPKQPQFIQAPGPPTFVPVQEPRQFAPAPSRRGVAQEAAIQQSYGRHRRSVRDL